MRLRSSLRCSKKVIAPAGSSAGVVIGVLDSDSGRDSGGRLVVMGSFLGTRNRGGFRPGFSRFFSRSWNRFDNRGNHWVLCSPGFRLRLAQWRVFARRNGRGGGWVGFRGGRPNRAGLPPPLLRRPAGAVPHFPPFPFSSRPF